MSYIYVITNDINNKQYVGKTNWSIEKRFREHINDSKRTRYEKRPLYNAINKYGIEHFSIKELEKCDESIVNEREQYWINILDTYKNGYNATLGGDSKHYYNYKEIADKYLELGMIKTVCDYFQCDPQTVRVACKEYNIKTKSGQEITKKRFSKAVDMLDIKTEQKIQTFSSLTEAALFLGDKNKAQHIGKVCNGIRKTAYGYKWKYVGD